MTAGTRDPLALAQDARQACEAGDWDGAARALREALAERPTFTFYARMQRLITRVAERSPDAVREARIAVLGSSTTSLLMPILRALCFRDRVAAQFHEGAYGAFRQEILDPSGPLAAFRPTIVIIAPHWRDLELPPLGADANRILEPVVAEYRTLWSTLHERYACHVVQHAFDLPADDSAGLLSSHAAAGRRQLIRRLNLAFAERLMSSVSLVDTEQLAAEAGLERWSDPRLWYVARQHPSSEVLPLLAEEQMAHVRAVLGLSRKVLVCDLDNTLWKGIVGEDGVDGIQVGPGSPDGEAHADLQRYIRELKERGIVLAVCSKNNPADALAPFRETAGMVLRREDFGAFEANWDDKVTNLRRIADAIGVGLDSLVVIDDNPVERGWIRSQLPEVAVPELGGSVFTYVRDLDRARCFPAITWSVEDGLRADSYRLEQAREHARTASDDLEGYLSSLEMRASCVPVSDGNIERVTQLTNKTNQFNVTTRRRTNAEVRELAASGWTGVFSLRDRFGDYGIIGVMFVQPAHEPQRWTIDTWLMSCRVLRRDVEKFMLDCLVDAARAAGVRTIHAEYIRTDKNALAADLFPSLGFSPLDASGDRSTYELHVNGVDGPLSRTIAHDVAGVGARD